MEIYAISVDTPEESRLLRQQLAAEYTFLSDAGRTVMDLLQLRHSQPNPAGGDIEMPTLILTDRSGIIRWIHQSEDYRVRARPEEILRIVDLSIR